MTKTGMKYFTSATTDAYVMLLFVVI